MGSHSKLFQAPNYKLNHSNFQQLPICNLHLLLTDIAYAPLSSTANSSRSVHHHRLQKPK